jgi:hypothetical protein
MLVKIRGCAVFHAGHTETASYPPTPKDVQQGRDMKLAKRLSDWRTAADRQSDRVLLDPFGGDSVGCSGVGSARRSGSVRGVQPATEREAGSAAIPAWI